LNIVGLANLRNKIFQNEDMIIPYKTQFLNYLVNIKRYKYQGEWNSDKLSTWVLV